MNKAMKKAIKYALKLDQQSFIEYDLAFVLECLGMDWHSAVIITDQIKASVFSEIDLGLTEIEDAAKKITDLAPCVSLDNALRALYWTLDSNEKKFRAGGLVFDAAGVYDPDAWESWD